MKNKKIKAGIIGLGNIAYRMEETKNEQRIWTHIKTYLSNENISEIVTLESNKESILQFNKKYPSIKVTNNLEEFLLFKPDVVSICTPTSTHFSIIKKLIKGGIKKIWCEKMLCNSEEEAIQIKKLCEENNICLLINFMRRWDDLFLNFKKEIEKNNLGRIYTVIAKTSTAFKMLSSHMIDLLIWYFGKPRLIYKELQTDYIRNVHGEKDYGGTAFLRFDKQDCLCILHSRSSSPFNFIFEIEVLCSNGVLIINTLEEMIQKEYLEAVPASKEHKTLKIKNKIKNTYSYSNCRMKRQLDFLIMNNGYNKLTEELIDDSIVGLKILSEITQNDN
tara:strand:- start:206 stop:1204 length:999 start_codon:yes stop_codon:yes gene_type:complete